MKPSEHRTAEATNQTQTIASEVVKRRWEPVRAGGRLRPIPEWLTLREAAAYLKVGVSTLHHWMDEGRLRYYCWSLESGVGRRLKREDLDQPLKPKPSSDSGLQARQDRTE